MLKRWLYVAPVAVLLPVLGCGSDDEASAAEIETETGTEPVGGRSAAAVDADDDFWRLVHGEDDNYAAVLEALEAAAKEAGVTAEIEVYPANHGWCALDSPVYDEAQAERAWARLLATYEAHL